MPFGCWWFMNNPSIVEEITRERIEMLGTSFIPQHSDARVLEQVIYKWNNTRRTLARILADTYRLCRRTVGASRAVTFSETLLASFVRTPKLGRARGHTFPMPPRKLRRRSFL